MGRKPRCKTCGRVVKLTSRNRSCMSCSMNKQIAVVRSMRAKKGIYYNRWKTNLLEALNRK